MIHLLVVRLLIDQIIDILSRNSSGRLARRRRQCKIPACNLDRTLRRVRLLRAGSPLRSSANSAPERSSLILSMEIFSSPAMSLANTTLPAVTLSSLPVS